MELRRRFSAPHPAVLPAVLWVLLVAEQLTARPPGMAVAIVGATVIAASFAVRRTRPLLTVVAVPLTIAAEALLGVSTKQTSVPILAVFWAIFLAFGVLTGRARLVGLLALVVGTAVGMLYDGGHLDVDNFVHSILFTVALCVPPAVTGTYVAGRHRYTAVVEERARALEAQRAAETEAALSQERLRIARELHDVIAHSVGLMGVQAGAVRRRLGPDQDALRDALVSVEDTARSAIEELRHVLGVLRGGDEPGRSPQPSMADLDALVAAARSAGQEVRLEVVGTPGTGAPGVEVSGYRIVQEILTNARKHAPGRPVEVRVEYGPAAVHIRARNPLGVLGAPASEPAVPSGGHGLLGMRERAHAFGGTLHAEAAEGWFTVHAELPTRIGVAS